MKVGFENRRQAITAAVLAPFALGAVIYLVMQLFPSSPSTPAPSTASTQSEQTAQIGLPTSAPQTTQTTQSSQTQPEHRAFANSELAPATSPLDPTLHPEIMFAAEHLEYTGNGRNIFSPNSAPPAQVIIPKQIAPARITPQVYVPTGPPPPPPVPFKLFGVETRADGSYQVFLQRGEDVFMAQVGDIVMRQYKITRITANSAEVEDLAHNNRQTLPLLR